MKKLITAVFLLSIINIALADNFPYPVFAPAYTVSLTNCVDDVQVPSVTLNISSNTLVIDDASPWNDVAMANINPDSENALINNLQQCLGKQLTGSELQLVATYSNEALSLLGYITFNPQFMIIQSDADSTSRMYFNLPDNNPISVQDMDIWNGYIGTVALEYNISADEFVTMTLTPEASISDQ